MGKLHSQLALFGSIDDEVVSRNDPRRTAIVERFLPGTTGYGQRGWFAELRTFIDHLAPGGAVEFPNREEALRDLIRPPQMTADPADSADDSGQAPLMMPRHQTLVREMSRGEFEILVNEGDPPPAPISRPNSETLTVSTLARATYAAAVIAIMDGPRREPPLASPVFVRHDRLGLVRIRDDGAPVDDDPLSTLLEMAVPYRYPGALTIDTLPWRPPLRDVISRDRLVDQGRPGWAPFMKRMVRDRAVDPWVAAYPPPCIGAVRKIGGEFCTVVTTEVFENVRLEQIEAIVDPRNWHQDLPSFFCRMEPRPDDPSGWRQVLECVSTECSEYRLKTALKYWNADRNEDGIYINYDLAADRTGDSGLVEVDSGYIWITRALPNGVRIKTSKALKICGLSPTATAALACYSGWAQVGIDMLVNAALQPHQGAIDWEPSTLPQTSPILTQQDPAPAEMSAPDDIESRLPDLPPGFRRDMVADSAEQANLYIDAAARLAKNFARRWQNGLTRTDVLQLGESAGKEMTDLAAGSFDSVMGNFRPKVQAVTHDEVARTPRPDQPDLVDRLADTARQVVGESKSVADEAADKIDHGDYSAAEMTATANKLAGIVFKSWVELAGIGLNPTSAPQPSSNPGAPSPATAPPGAEATRFRGNGLGSVLQAMSELANRAFLMNLDVVKNLLDQRFPEKATVVTDHMAEVIRRMANQARTVADDATKKLDAEGYSADDWAKTITKFGDVALMNGIELVGTALVGPGRYEKGPITSDLFTVQNADPHQRHKLKLTAPLALAGSSGEVISEDCVTFDPVDGVLRAGRSRFRIRVKPAGLRSGIYVGAVWAIPLDESGSEATSDEISEEVVPVIIGV